MSLFARTKRFTWKMKETTNSIQRTCSTHLPSIKSWFIPVLLRTLCIMWQCTTVQWSGLHFVTLGGRGDSVRGGVRGSSSLKLLWRGVFWFLHLRGRPTCFFVVFFTRVIKDSGMRFVVCFFKITWTCLPSWMFPHVSEPLLWASHLLDGCDRVTADWTVRW